MKDRQSYLRRAAVNASLDLIRSRGDDRNLELIDVSSGARDPDAGELKAALRRALGRLTAKSAEIFVLRFLEGFSNKEIAQMLDMSAVLVAVTVHRARQQLQRDLRAYR
jgi:RNA polymerase sigma-70 factor (ECF subfamily)